MDITEKLIAARNKEQDKATEGLGFQNKSLFEDLINTEDGVEVYASNALNAKTKDLLRSSLSWIYACCGARADGVSGINLHLWKSDKDGEAKEVFNHPALDLLYRVNNGMTTFDLFWLSEQYLSLTGEAPWFVGFNGSKIPETILLLRPDQLTVLPPTEEGEIIGGYIYKVFKGNGRYEEIKLTPEEVIFHRYPDPDKPLRGLGPLQAVMAAYQTDQKASKFNLEFFNKSAIPSAVLKTSQKLTKEQHERLQKQIERKYSGVANAHKTMLLESGLDYQSMTISQREMDFIEGRKFNRDEILAIFRVPRTVLGITDDVNRANAEATDYVFMSRTIKPEMRRFVEALNEFFLPLFPNSETLYFGFEDPTPENKDLLIKQANDGLVNGYLTINESRSLLGYEPVEGGDVLAPKQVDPFAGASLKKKKNKNNVGSISARKAAMRQRKNEIIEKGIEYAEEILTSTFAKIAKDQLRKERKVKNLGEVVVGDSPFKGTEEEVKTQKLTFQAVQLSIADDYEPKLAGKMRQVFRSQRRQILEDFPTEKADVPKGFPKLDIDTEIQITGDAVRPTLKQVIIKQSKPAYQIIGIDRELSAAAAPVARYLDKYVFKLSKQITQQTNELLGSALAEGVSKGESIPQLRKRVQELFTGMESYRADRIARTETIRASNFASEEAWKESEIVAGKEWITAIDERTDSECLDLDGEVVALSSLFSTPEGKISGPPLHVNCRCTTAPIIKR